MSGICENIQLFCAVCKIGAYSLFCRMCCQGQPQPRPEFSAVCIGLAESGKTSLLTALCKENVDDIEPTRGFFIKAVQFNNCIINIKEVGGGEKVRPFWKHYYRDTQAIIYVVDSAVPADEMEDAREALREALGNILLKSLPCLILANCQDKKDARTEQQIRDDLDLAKTCEGRPWALHLCSLKDIEDVRDGFAKISVFLMAPDKEDYGRNTTTSPNDNRI